MPFCPKCRDEFQDWVKTCPDCRVRLVAELRAETEPTPSLDHAWRHARPAKAKDELVRLATASNEPEARMWAGVLEDNGIRSMVKPYSPGGYDSSSDPIASVIQPSGMLQFDVYVLESDLERAGGNLGRIPDRASEAGVAHGRRAKSARSNEPLVLVATPSNAAEAAMLAETLEDNGIHCTTRGLHGKTVRSSAAPRQIHVLESDATRAREILGRVYDSAGRAGLSDGLPAKKRRWITTAVGIIDIVWGMICLCLAAAFWTSGALSDVEGYSQTYARVAPIALVAIGVVAIPGGVCVLRRTNWWMAVAGNVALALSSFLLGLLFLAPIVMYKDEFE